MPATRSLANNVINLTPSTFYIPSILMLKPSAAAHKASKPGYIID
jgi:hypothetical protein